MLSVQGLTETNIPNSNNTNSKFNVDEILEPPPLIKNSTINNNESNVQSMQIKTESLKSNSFVLMANTMELSTSGQSNKVRLTCMNQQTANDIDLSDICSPPKRSRQQLKDKHQLTIPAQTSASDINNEISFIDNETIDQHRSDEMISNEECKNIKQFCV